MDNNKTEQVNRQRKAISFLHQAARELELSGSIIEVLSLDMFIARREEDLDKYLNKNFPIVEKTTPRISKD